MFKEFETIQVQVQNQELIETFLVFILFCYHNLIFRFPPKLFLKFKKRKILATWPEQVNKVFKSFQMHGVTKLKF
jgi:hypothetical protein